MSWSLWNKKVGNENNHDEDGQNALYSDGHVRFEQNPFVGIQRSNIFTRKSGSTSFTGDGVIATPSQPNDSILLPADDKAPAQPAAQANKPQDVRDLAKTPEFDNAPNFNLNSGVPATRPSTEPATVETRHHPHRND